MIELAPNHKRGLVLDHPLMLAAGGFAPTDISSAAMIPALLSLGVGAPTAEPRFGAFVTLPLTRSGRAGGAQPRVIEIPGGVLVRTGAANPGLYRVLRDYRRAWAKSSIPIIVALASQGARDWAEIARELERVEGVGGIELQFNPTFDAADALRAVRAATELPLIAKLDLENALKIAPGCVSAGANAVVIARAPRVAQMVEGKIWHGRMYAPSVKPIVLEKLLEIRDLKLDAPLIAGGGMHSARDGEDFIAAGASAVQVDSAVWVGML